MQRAEAAASIPVPADQIFAFLADPANLPRWQTGIVAAEVKTPGPVGVGSTARVSRSVLGQEIDADLRVIAYEQDRRVVLATEVAGIGAEVTLELTADGPSTDVRVTMEFKARGLLMAPFEGTVAGAAQGDLVTSLERLRAHFAAPPA